MCVGGKSCKGGSMLGLLDFGVACLPENLDKIQIWPFMGDAWFWFLNVIHTSVCLQRRSLQFIGNGTLWQRILSRCVSLDVATFSVPGVSPCNASSVSCNLESHNAKSWSQRSAGKISMAYICRDHSQIIILRYDRRYDLLKIVPEMSGIPAMFNDVSLPLSSWSYLVGRNISDIKASSEHWKQ